MIVKAYWPPCSTVSLVECDSDEEDEVLSFDPVTASEFVSAVVPGVVLDAVPVVLTVAAVESVAVDTFAGEESTSFSGSRAFSISRMNCCDAFSYKSNEI